MKKRFSPFLLLTFATALATAQELPPMAATADPAFEIATIKLSDPNSGSSGSKPAAVVCLC